MILFRNIFLNQIQKILCVPQNLSNKNFLRPRTINNLRNMFCCQEQQIQIIHNCYQLYKFYLIRISDPGPTHPEMNLSKICTKKQCLEPICPKCQPIHLAYHDSIGIKASISPINQVKKRYLSLASPSSFLASAKETRLQEIQTIIKQYIDEYFSIIRQPGKFAAQKNPSVHLHSQPLRNKQQQQNIDIKTLLEMMIHDQSVELPADFKKRVYSFLQNNIYSVNNRMDAHSGILQPLKSSVSVQFNPQHYL